jgi:hypothetical protein
LVDDGRPYSGRASAKMSALRQILHSVVEPAVQDSELTPQANRLPIFHDGVQLASGTCPVAAPCPRRSPMIVCLRVHGFLLLHWDWQSHAHHCCR